MFLKPTASMNHFWTLTLLTYQLSYHCRKRKTSKRICTSFYLRGIFIFLYRASHTNYISNLSRKFIDIRTEVRIVQKISLWFAILARGNPIYIFALLLQMKDLHANFSYPYLFHDSCAFKSWLLCDIRP